MSDTCKWCAAPVAFDKPSGSWVHTQPLAALRVTHYEYEDVMAARPDRFKSRGSYRPNLHYPLPRRF